MIIRIVLELLAIVGLIIMIMNEPKIVDWEDRQIAKIKSLFYKDEP